MAEPTKLSVIIPSYQGLHRLPIVLAALKAQDYKNFEVVVVVDGSTDGSVDYLNSLNASFPLRVVEQENKGRAGARNAGAACARGEFLIFYDDDMQPDRNSLSRHMWILQKYKGAISAGAAPERARNQNEFTQYKASLTEKWNAGLGDEPVVLSQQALMLTAANMACSAATFKQLNGFDENLRDIEDYDLAVRAFGTGIPVVFDPQNKAWHISFESFWEYVLRQREYRTANERLINLRRNSPYYQLYKKYQVRKAPVKKLVYFFVSPILLRAADKNYFRVFPKKLRYGIYARIVAALAVYYPNRRINEK